MRRRDFLTSSGQALLASLILASCRSAPPAYSTTSRKGKIFLAFEGKDQVSVARILDLDNHTFQDFELPIKLPHSIMRSVANPEDILAFEFFGSAVKINERTGAVTKITGTQDNLFHGHAVQSDDGKVIWTTEHLPNLQTNLVRGRRIEDLSIIDDKAGFKGGHHIVRLPGSSILVSGGSTPEKKHFLSFYDAKAQKLVQTLPMEEVMGHLVAFSPSEIIGVSNSVKMSDKESNELSKYIKTKELDLTGEAPLVYANLKGEIKSFWDEGRKDIFRFGFGLDLIPGSPGMYLTGHHHSNTVILWDHFKIVKVFPIHEPFGILVSREGSEFVVLTKGTLEIYSLKTLERTKTIRYERPVSLLSRYA